MPLKEVSWTEVPFYSSYSGHAKGSQQVLRYSGGQLVGSPNPRFRQQIKSGRNATTEMTANLTNIDATPFNAQRTIINAGGKFFYEGAANVSLFQLGFPIGIDASRVGRVKNQAIGKFANNVRSAITSFAGPTFVAELRDTVRLLRNPTQGIIDVCQAYKRAAEGQRRLWKGRELDTHLAALWLQYAYAVRPLVSEVESALETIKRLYRPEMAGVRGSADDEWQLHNLQFDDSIGGYLRAHRDYRVSVKAGVRIVGAVKRTVAAGPNPSIPTLSDLTGMLQPQEYLMAGVELIPFSFLAGYISNVNEILSATYMTSGNLAWVSMTQRTSALRTVVVNPYYTDPPLGWKVGSTSIQSGIGQTEFKELKRTADVPVPGLQFEAPSLGQLFNTAALAAVLAPKPKR